MICLLGLTSIFPCVFAAVTLTPVLEPSDCFTSGACLERDASVLLQSSASLSIDASIGTEAQANMANVAAAGPTKAVLQYDTKELQGRTANRFVHLVSSGREGSCFLGQEFHNQPMPYVFEPDNNDGWGTFVSTSVEMSARLKCIYNCIGCKDVVEKSGNKTNGLMDEICSKSPLIAAIKTVSGFSDFQHLVDAVDRSTINATKFVLFIRDPRGMFHSVEKAGWGTSPWSCRNMLQKLLSAKEFKEKMGLGDDSMKTIFFEWWSQNVESFVPSLFDWVGLSPSAAVLDKATSSKKDSAFAWRTDWEDSDIQAVNDGSYCGEYMDLLGIPRDPKSSRLQRFQGSFTTCLNSG